MHSMYPSAINNQLRALGGILIGAHKFCETCFMSLSLIFSQLIVRDVYDKQHCSDHSRPNTKDQIQAALNSKKQDKTMQNSTTCT